MSSRRSPPRGNSGGFAFEVVANPGAVLPAVLDEDLVGVEPGGEHAGDVHARYVGLHRGGGVPGDTPGLVPPPAERAGEAQGWPVPLGGPPRGPRGPVPFPARARAAPPVRPP